jgi:hypothetical protein
MDSTRHQEILDRCWEALPEGCPMRQWDREQFDDVWGCWDPMALALVDPTCSNGLSIFFAVAWGDIDDYPTKEQARVIGEHYRWLVASGEQRELKNWHLATMKCLNNRVQPDKQLIYYIEGAIGLPTIEKCIDENGFWGIARQAEIKAQCLVDYPKIFEGRIDDNSWRSIINKAKKHLGKIPKCNAGRPKN